jgi:hypothetical protein
LINGRVHPSLKRMGLFARQVFVQVPMLDSSWFWLSADARFLFWTRRVYDRVYFSNRLGHEIRLRAIALAPPLTAPTMFRFNRERFD